MQLRSRGGHDPRQIQHSTREEPTWRCSGRTDDSSCLIWWHRWRPPSVSTNRTTEHHRVARIAPWHLSQTDTLAAAPSRSARAPSHAPSPCLRCWCTPVVCVGHDADACRFGYVARVRASGRGGVGWGGRHLHAALHGELLLAVLHLELLRLQLRLRRGGAWSGRNGRGTRRRHTRQRTRMRAACTSSCSSANSLSLQRAVGSTGTTGKRSGAHQRRMPYCKLTRAQAPRSSVGAVVFRS